MFVNSKDGCKVLRVSGKEEKFTGALTLSHIKDEIGADMCEYCETIEGGRIVIDEEGKICGKRPNFTATHMYKYSLAFVRNQTLLRDYIVGDVVYIPKHVWERWEEEKRKKDK